MRRLSSTFHLFIIFGLALLYLTTPAMAGADEESLYQEARSSYHELSKSAKMRKYRHNWIKVIDSYEKVFHQFPGGKEGLNRSTWRQRPMWNSCLIQGRDQNLGTQISYWENW